MRQGQALALLSLGQYAHVARIADEVGRLLGGWRRSLGRPTPGALPDSADPPPDLN